MAQSKITIIGLEEWLNIENDSLFSNMNLPEGINKDTLVGNILMRGGDFELLYPNPTFLKQAIELWANKCYWTFDKWVRAINIDYNPLENYDRSEEWSESADGNTTNTNSGTTTDSSTGSGTVETTKSAFNSSSYEPYDKNTSNTNSNATTTVNASNNGADHRESAHNGRIHGNIGVTTSQQMLQSELDVATFNLIDRITDLFLSEFCLLVY